MGTVLGTTTHKLNTLKSAELSLQKSLEFLLEIISDPQNSVYAGQIQSTENTRIYLKKGQNQVTGSEVKSCLVSFRSHLGYAMQFWSF